MNDLAILDDPRAIASTLQWWADAGVDMLVDEEPRIWTGRLESTPQSAMAAPVGLPTTLVDLVAWMATTDEFSSIAPPERRISPFGTPGSPVMILTDTPEASDVDAGMLFSGELGALFDKMLAALRLDRSRIYCASLSPARPLSGRIDEILLPRLAEIARHHIHLAAPKRVWLLGQTTSRALLGMDDVAARGKLHLINHEGHIVESVVSIHPRRLIQSPQRKADVWIDMQRLVEGIET